MKVQEVCQIIEDFAPPAYQESYDNSGLLVGERDMVVNGVLLTLDLTEQVLDEAIAKGANMIIMHHPIIFSGLKKLRGDTLSERCVIKAIRNEIALYAAHTNMDAMQQGVNAAFVKKLKLQDPRILAPRKQSLLKLVSFIPESHLEPVRSALFEAGAGGIGNYDCCSFSHKGIGSFRAGKLAKPFVGQHGEMHYEAEIRLEVVFAKYKQGAVLAALKRTHPYEEVAYDLFALENEHPYVGAGIIGSLSEEIHAFDFLALLKQAFSVEVIKHSADKGKKIKKVAVCGGSGNFLIGDALREGADILVSSEFKYHDFIDIDGQMMLADIGHFEGEQFTCDLFVELLTKKITKFACSIAEACVNPVNYYK